MAAMQAQLQQLQQQEQQSPVVIASVVAAPTQAIIPAVIPDVRQVPEAGGQRLEPIYERFLKKSPPTFEGGQDPTVVKQWMSMNKIVLDFMGLFGHDQVKCAMYTFRKDACTWWDVIS